MKNLISGKIGLVSCTILLFSTLFTACGGGSSSLNSGPGGESPEKVSELYVGLTDAEGDFLTYLVDVKQINLHRADGSVVNLLPESTSVDFAQYVEVTELLTRVTAPAGRYDSASLTLDFSAAVITVQDENGASIQADPVDDAGDPLTERTIDIQFGDHTGFVLTAGRAAQITLDFDLDASNLIQFDGNGAQVTVNPVLLADTVLEAPKPFRLRGLLGRVLVDENSFQIDLRPFRKRDRAFGEVRVHVTEDTHYEINGNVIRPEEGLVELAALPENAPVIAMGAWKRDERRFVAREVYAGSSVPWGEADALRGTVVARAGNTLTVRGAIVEFRSGTFRFNDEVSVLISEDTRIVQVRDSEADINSISVGSAIFVSGALLDDASIDATEGAVRIVPGSATGAVVSASPLALDLNMVNGRRAALYNFTGTGISLDNDADPDNYEVALSTLSVDGLEVGDPVRVKGWVADFGAAPEDFHAISVRHASDVRGHMVITYSPDGVTNAISSLDENGILFDTSEAGERHHMVFAGIPVDLNSLSAGVPLVVPGEEPGVYSLSAGDRSVVSTTFARFVELLTAELEAGRQVVRFDAQGHYEAGENTFVSRRLRVRLTQLDESSVDQALLP